MNDADLADLAHYRQVLEQPAFVARASSVIGSPVEKLLDHLPARWRESVHDITRKALEKSLSVAADSLDPQVRVPSPGLHKLAAGATGALGGAFGLPALAIELPVSTTLMLRGIADVARASGEDLARPDVRLECLNVFALGGVSGSDDAAESGYFAVRAALARGVGEAAAWITERGLAGEGAPALLRLVAMIAARFQVQVSQKAAAQAVPLIGAASGAALNVAFMAHFQNIAAAHFGIRRLERQYGADAVRQAYEQR